MAFNPKSFVLCSKTPLFKADAKLWLYSTADTLEDCLAENYFKPRENLKNQDSPNVGDIIQILCESSKIAYVKITTKTEKPYNITVARTYLENEADIIAELADKASKTTDFSTPITDENLGITQAEQSELEGKIDLAANSGRMITAQGFWYAKMHSETVAPSADNGTNYADFSQVDGDGNPIIVTYVRTGDVWVQDQTIIPPADYDGYVAITSKIWDIAEQDGQQGGRVLWNHVSKEFTPYPQIISFDSVELTGDSTVVMPVTPDDDNIANVGFVLEHCAARNVGDIFYTSRKDSVLNGAVPCDGTQYQTTDFSGAQAPGALLQAGKLPYVPLATYATLLSTNGSVGVFGWDGLGTTAFKVPTLTDIFIETGTAAHVGDYLAPGLPDHSHTVTAIASQKTVSGGSGADNRNPPESPTTITSSNASASNSIYGHSNTVQPNSVRYRAMIQLSTGSSDQSLGMLAEVAYSGQYSDLLNKPTIPTNVSQLTNDAGYIDSIKTINNNSLVGSGNLELSTYLPFAAGWPTTGTTKLFCDSIASDTSAVKGKAYLGEVTFSDLPASMANGEVVVEIMSGTTALDKVITLTLTSGNVSPYMWRYTYWNNGNNVSGWQTWATSAQGAKADTAVQPGDLATVAITGAYSDLSGTPTIPTVGDGTITITQGGVTKGTFTTNQASASTIALDAGGATTEQSIDAEIVGTLTVADNGDVSGFSSSNYLEYPGDIDMTNASTFEIVMVVTRWADSGGYFISERPDSILTDKHLTFMITGLTNPVLRFDVNDGSNYQSLTGTTILATNTKYYAKIAYDGTNYTLSLSTDGINYTTEATDVAQYLPGETTYPYVIGRASTAWHYIHMSECYIKKNGILVWQGMDAPGLHQRVVKGHEVIDFQAPMSSNNYTWYRKYADGWVEQGGITTSGTIVQSVALPVTMADTNYTISLVATSNAGNGKNNVGIVGYENVSTTGFDTRGNTVNGQNESSTATGVRRWEVKGMAA